jgi:hypothetical protein
MNARRLPRPVRRSAAVLVAAGATLAGAQMAQAQAQSPTDPSRGMTEEELLRGVPGEELPPSMTDEEPGPGITEEELTIELLQRSLRFGGLFGGLLEDWANSPSAPPAAEDACSGYAEYAAQQACGVGDLWAADRIEEDRASPEERDWYDR